MKSTLYFPDVAPGSEQFNYGEVSSGEALLERFKVISSMGVYVGFSVTVNAFDSTQIDIEAGEGYSPSGERFYSAIPSSAGIDLADYTQDARNFIALKYVGATGTPLIERFDPFRSFNTLVADSFEIEIFTENNWNNLTTTQLENRLLVGIVTTQGAGNALSQSNIELATRFAPAISVTQPSAITGVSITQISTYTFEGTGTLKYDSASQSLSWLAPADGSFGSIIQVPTDGLYSIPSVTTANYIIVNVVTGILPAASTEEAITVSSLYDQEIPRYSAADAHHRSQLGTGIPTSNNPHGLRSEDLGGATESLVIDHQDLMHANGILRSSDENVLKATAVNLGIDKLSIVAPLLNDVFYVDGRKLFEIETPKLLSMM